MIDPIMVPLDGTTAAARRRNLYAGPTHGFRFCQKSG
jgi:hypothetical protein